MTKNTTNIESLLQNSLFTEDNGVVETKPSFNDELQAALLRDKTEDRSVPHRSRRTRMPRLIDDLRRRMLLRFVAIAAVTAGSVYGLSKGISYGSEKLKQAKLDRYMRNVPESQRAEAERFYRMPDEVKMVRYELGESRRVSGRGIFERREAELVEDYDMDRDGQADIRVTTKTDPEIFLGWEEGDYANKTHGPWGLYSEPMSKVAKETSAVNGKIVNLHTGQVIDFSKKKTNGGM